MFQRAADCNTISPTVLPKGTMPTGKILTESAIRFCHKMLLCQKMAHNIT